MRALKILALFVLALVGNAIFWSSGGAFGMLVLCMATGMAIAGPRNRLIWSMGAALLIVLAGSLFAFRAMLPNIDGNPFFGVLAFGLLPMVPALLLGSAHGLRRARLRPARAADLTQS